jgi:uncharacterized protein YbaR (Trm112 family)
VPIDPALLSIIACPACDDRPPLREEGATLICDKCHRVYPVLDGIPVLLPEEATIPEKSAQSE